MDAIFVEHVSAYVMTEKLKTVGAWVGLIILHAATIEFKKKTSLRRKVSKKNSS